MIRGQGGPVFSLLSSCLFYPSFLFSFFFSWIGWTACSKHTRTHADQGIGDIAHCVQSDLGSDSMFRSVNVQVCKKKGKGGTRIVLFLICFAVTIIMCFLNCL